MKPHFQKKISARLYLLLKLLFIAILIAWLPTIALIASEDGFSRELAFVLCLVATTPLVIEWIALFFCIRYLILLKTNKISWTGRQKALAVLYGAMALIALFVFVTVLGSAFQVFNTAFWNLYVWLPVITTILGMATLILSLIEKKKLNIVQIIE